MTPFLMLKKINRRLRVMLAKAWFGTKKTRLRNIDIEGFEIIAATNEVLGRHFVALGEYEKEETEFLRAVVKQDDVCLDIGGNVGYFTMLFAQLAPKGQIHTFEPIPKNAALIRASAALNGFENVRVTSAAVGREPGKVQFTISEDSAYSSIHDTGRVKATKTVEVPIISLDGYVENAQIKRVDVLKIDVEGAELDALEGGGRLFADPLTKPRLILIELVDENLAAFGTDTRTILDRLERWHYAPHIIVDRLGSLAEYGLAATKHYNIVMVATDVTDRGQA